MISYYKMLLRHPVVRHTFFLRTSYDSQSKPTICSQATLNYSSLWWRWILLSFR